MIWWEVPKKSSFDDEILKEISMGKSCNGFFGCPSWHLSAHISHILQIAIRIKILSVSRLLNGFLPSTRPSCGGICQQWFLAKKKTSNRWCVNQISALWFGFCRVNGLKFTCKFQERCQIPAISAPGSEAAQHQVLRWENLWISNWEYCFPHKDMTRVTKPRGWRHWGLELNFVINCGSWCWSGESSLAWLHG